MKLIVLIYHCFKLATKLEEIALNDDYFKKKLYPNVDFYSGIILKALGMPESMFTVLFCSSSNCWLDLSMERNDRVI